MIQSQNSLKYTSPVKKSRWSLHGATHHKTLSLPESWRQLINTSVQRRRFGVGGPLKKTCSINIEESYSQTEQNINFVDKLKKDPIHRQKIKLVLAKNGSIVKRQQKMEYSSNPKKMITLKQMIRHDKLEKVKQIKVQSSGFSLGIKQAKLDLF